jgi:hypothetical protein
MDERTKKFVEVLKKNKDSIGAEIEAMDSEERKKLMVAIREERAQLDEKQELEQVLTQIAQTFVDFGIVKKYELEPTRGILTGTNELDEPAIRKVAKNALENIFIRVDAPKKMNESFKR